VGEWVCGGGGGGGGGVGVGGGGGGGGWWWWCGVVVGGGGGGRGGGGDGNYGVPCMRMAQHTRGDAHLQVKVGRVRLLLPRCPTASDKGLCCIAFCKCCVVVPFVLDPKSFLEFVDCQQKLFKLFAFETKKKPKKSTKSKKEEKKKRKRREKEEKKKRKRREKEEKKKRNVRGANTHQTAQLRNEATNKAKDACVVLMNSNSHGYGTRYARV
jgi:hypothetical protein